MMLDHCSAISDIDAIFARLDRQASTLSMHEDFQESLSSTHEDHFSPVAHEKALLPWWAK